MFINSRRCTSHPEAYFIEVPSVCPTHLEHGPPPERSIWSILWDRPCHADLSSAVGIPLQTVADLIASISRSDRHVSLSAVICQPTDTHAQLQGIRQRLFHAGSSLSLRYRPDDHRHMSRDVTHLPFTNTQGPVEITSSNGVAPSRSRRSSLRRPYWRCFKITGRTRSDRLRVCCRTPPPLRHHTPRQHAAISLRIV